MNILMYVLIILFLGGALYKLNRHKVEWLLLLVILSFIKTCLLYLFEAGTVFTVFTLGGIQIHLDDIIMAICFFFVLFQICRPFRANRYTASTLLLAVPILISILRGALSWDMSFSIFFANARTYLLFLFVFYAFYFQTRKTPQSKTSETVSVGYIEKLMNCVLAYVLVIWVLDLFFGIRNLPGQENGLLSDGGSTFRIIHPQQTLVIAIYTLFCLYQDLYKKRSISPRTVVFSLVIVLLQWRTVVFAFLIAFIFIVIYYCVKRGVSTKLLIEMFAFVVVAFLVSLLGTGESTIGAMIDNLFNSFSSISEGTGTFLTRTQVWRGIINSLDGVNLFLGRPFGQSLGISWAASAHSGYIDYIARMGILGLIGLVVFMLYLIYRAVKQRKGLMAFICFAILLYWIGYGFSLEQGAILGFMLGYLERDHALRARK